MKARWIGAVVAVVMAVLGSWVLLSYVQRADERALAGTRTVEVLVVEELVAAGTPAEELPDLVTSSSIPVNLVVPGRVESIDQLAGLVATVDLQPGEQLLASRFAAVVDAAAAEIVEVPTSLQELTISLEPQRALGGSLLAGSTVGVFVSGDPEVPGPTTHLTLHKVLVTRVQSGDGPLGAAQDETLELPLPSSVLVTLAVTSAQAEQVVFGAEHGRVWLSLEPETADESGTGVLTWDSVYE